MKSSKDRQLSLKIGGRMEKFQKAEKEPMSDLNIFEGIEEI